MGTLNLELTDAQKEIISKSFQLIYDKADKMENYGNGIIEEIVKLNELLGIEILM